MAKSQKLKPEQSATAANAGAETAAPVNIVGPEEIARLAYAYWEARDQEGGSPEEDWFRAERELTSRPPPG